MQYTLQTKLLLAVDCIIFGFDGTELKLLLIKRSMDPEINKWSLMGGFIEPKEDLPQAAGRILQNLTGLTNVYQEELHSFSAPERDPAARTVSVAYFALIDINKYEQQLSNQHKAAWFPLKKFPKLIFDHNQMVKKAWLRLQYKAAFHPILFELLPPKFTLPQLQLLYESVYNMVMDKRNFSRKVLSTGLLIKQTEKNKADSKKGAYYYKLHKKKYHAGFHSVLNLIPNPDTIYS
jgi:ADP-ribose pyrophosphatase YjhB (NUDIX family)